MSIPVDPTKLGEELEKFGHSAFLLTVRDDDTPHVAHMTFRLQQGDLYCPISKTAARNVQVRPNVVVLWPPHEPNGYSMILDAECRLHGEELMLIPKSGVLHRPAAPEASGELDCGNDCAPLGS